MNKTLRTAKTPYVTTKNKGFGSSSCQPTGGEWRDSLRTVKWRDLLPDTEASLEEINQLFSVPSNFAQLQAGGRIKEGPDALILIKSSHQTRKELTL